MFSFCSENYNQFCGELRGKGHKEDIRLVCPTKCERLSNKRCMAAFLITPTSFVIFRMKSWRIVSCALSEFFKGLLTIAEALKWWIGPLCILDLFSIFFAAWEMPFFVSYVFYAARESAFFPLMFFALLGKMPNQRKLLSEWRLQIHQMPRTSLKASGIKMIYKNIKVYIKW